MLPTVPPQAPPAEPATASATAAAGSEKAKWGDEDMVILAKAMRLCDRLQKLDLSHNKVGSKGAAALAPAIAVSGELTVVNVLRNNLDVPSAKMLAAVAKEKGISLCGIKRDQTEAEFSHQDLKPPDALLLASDLSQAGVTGKLTKIDLSNNMLGGDGEAALRKAVEGRSGFELVL